jgi:hypothetical protein
MPAITMAPPTGSYQCTPSPSTSTPRRTPTTGVRYVTVDARAAPQSRITRVYQTYATPVPTTPSATMLSTTGTFRATGPRASSGASTSTTALAIASCTDESVIESYGRPLTNLRRYRPANP